MRTSRAIHTEIGVAEHQEAAHAVLTNCIRGPRAAAPLLAQTTESLHIYSDGVKRLTSRRGRMRARAPRASGRHDEYA